MKYIYKIENMKNGKVYIGQTFNYKERFASHKSALKHKYINEVKKYDEMRKGGIENLEYSVIEEVEDNISNEMEKYYIEKYDSINNGYNTSKGGIGNVGTPTEETLLKRSNALKKVIHTKEWHEKIGLANRGKTVSTETREKISNSLKGNVISEKTREAVRIASTGRIKSEEERLKISEKVSKPIVQLDLLGNLIKRYDNARIAGMETNTNHTNISSCCNGKRNKAGGYIWKFEKEYYNE